MVSTEPSVSSEDGLELRNNHNKDNLFTESFPLDMDGGL